MALHKNKGGAPTKEKKALWEKLHKTGLFNRSSSSYINIEKALDELPPAKAFEMFSRLCMIRDSSYLHLLKQDLSSFDKDKEEWFLWTIGEERILSNKRFEACRNKLKQIKEISLEVYGIYLLLSASNNIINIWKDGKQFTSDDDLNFSIKSEIKLKHIFNLYPREQQSKIISACINREKTENIGFNEILNNLSESIFTEKLIFSILKEYYPIDLNYLKDPDHLFFLPSFDIKDNKEFITKTVEEAITTYSTTTIHSGKNIYLRVNPDKPLEHYQQMFKLLQMDLDINTDLHSKTFSNVLAHNTSQKSIAGKMTDLLYIYDNHLYGYSIAWTIDEITSYWREKKPKYWESKTIMSRSTYSTYKKIIDNFIDNKRYKH